MYTRRLKNSTNVRGEISVLINSGVEIFDFRLPVGRVIPLLNLVRSASIEVVEHSVQPFNIPLYFLTQPKIKSEISRQLVDGNQDISTPKLI